MHAFCILPLSCGCWRASGHAGPQRQGVVVRMVCISFVDDATDPELLVVGGGYVPTWCRLYLGGRFLSQRRGLILTNRRNGDPGSDRRLLISIDPKWVGLAKKEDTRSRPCF